MGRRIVMDDQVVEATPVYVRQEARLRLEEISEGMEGMKPGEQRTISVTFPEEYHAKDLAGKAATFDITAKAL